MPDNNRECVTAPGPVSIHTNQIIDSCFDKDCIEDVRVWLTAASQTALDNATGAKTRCAELLYVHVEVDCLPYKSGYYAIDMTFYYRILGDALNGSLRPTTINGLAVFSKRVVLCGGKACAKTFRSTQELPPSEELLRQTLPTAVVEALDPMILSSCVRAVCECRCTESAACSLPQSVTDSFGEQLVLSGEKKRLYVTLGQFSTVRLERETQITVPTMEYSAPRRECCADEGCEENPCERFSREEFPMRSFFPNTGDCRGKNDGCCCR